MTVAPFYVVRLSALRLVCERASNGGEVCDELSIV